MVLIVTDTSYEKIINSVHVECKTETILPSHTEKKEIIPDFYQLDFCHFTTFKSNLFNYNPRQPLVVYWLQHLISYRWHVAIFLLDCLFGSRSAMIDCTRIRIIYLTLLNHAVLTQISLLPLMTIIQQFCSNFSIFLIYTFHILHTT